MNDCVLAAQRAIQSHICGVYRDLSAVRHSIFRIHHQIHDYLLKLASVRSRSAQTSRELGREFDVLTDQRTEQPFHIRNDRVYIHHFQLQ